MVTFLGLKNQTFPLEAFARVLTRNIEKEKIIINLMFKQNIMNLFNLAG